MKRISWFAVMVAVGVLLSACTSDGDDKAAVETTSTSTSTSIVPPGPRVACETAEEAARVVEQAWSSADDAAALRCGTADAVERLFAASAGDASVRAFQSCETAAPDSPVNLCRFEEPGRGVELEVQPVRDGGFYVTDVRIGSAGG